MAIKKELLRDNKQVFVLCSSTNIDSIVEFFSVAIAGGEQTHAPAYKRSRNGEADKTGLRNYESKKSFYQYTVKSQRHSMT